MNDQSRLRPIVFGLLVLLSMALAGCGMLRAMVEGADRQPTLSGNTADDAANATGDTGMNANATEWTAGEDVTVRGIVVENVQRCTVNGQCALTLDTQNGIVTAIYHYGENPPCPNRAATQQGFGMVAGDEVEVVGVTVEAATISTCESETYRITKLS